MNLICFSDGLRVRKTPCAERPRAFGAREAQRILFKKVPAPF